MRQRIPLPHRSDTFGTIKAKCPYPPDDILKECPSTEPILLIGEADEADAGADIDGRPLVDGKS